jgi:hypothetical protein
MLDIHKANLLTFLFYTTIIHIKKQNLHRKMGESTPRMISDLPILISTL